MSFVSVNSRRGSSFAAILLFAFASGCGESIAEPSLDELRLDLQSVATGLTAPVYLTTPAGDSRQFIVEQPGRIRVVKGGQLLTTPFLDITAKVLYGDERGLLSVAFDPQYATNGFFYVYYTSRPNGDIVVERYGSAVGEDAAGQAFTPVISIPHATFANHNGGLVMFGPDGMLYMGTGDGGSGGDPNGNGQNQNVLLGKLLRLDVRTLPYTIPATNPFAGVAGKRGEIWAYGLRNPWRFAFDRGTTPATLYVADVGQNLYEEVNVVAATTAGINYGWVVMEGLHCYPSGDSCTRTGLTQPVLEYSHASGCSITGGFVYRGAAIPALAGQYFYSDYCSGFVASLSGSLGGTFASRTWAVPNVGHVLSFGEDSMGELYVLSASGIVYRIVKA
jgi:glucose/arabinose dehydrogenase